MSANGPGLLVIERILRDRHSIWQQIVEDRDLNRITGQMLVSSAIALACYGAVLGAFHSFLMALTSAVKLPILFLITLTICLPTLYLFNLVFGARLSVRQALALVMVAITVTSMLAVAFAPISLFFLITAPNYGFFKLLNVAILTLSAIVGLRFLTAGMQVLNEHGLLTPIVVERAGSAVPATTQAAAVATQPATPVLVAAGAAVPAESATETATATATAAQPVPAAAQSVATLAPSQPMPVSVQVARPATAPEGQRPASMTLLYIWILLFGFVGTQLAWTLRPFFGSPDQGFAFFRSIEGNFYTEVVRTIGNLF